jgi:hypothetical protein
VFLVIEHIHVTMQVYNLRLGLLDEFIDVSSLNDSRRSLLRLWQEALFPLKQNGFSVLFELGVSEHLGTGSVNNLARPQVLAPHAVSIGAKRQEVGLDTGSTRIEITKWARNLFVI